MSNSSLVNYTRISPNKTSPRNHVIDTITIHCYVGQVTAKQGCDSSRFIKYNSLTGASCNYVVGYDGSIGLCVDERDRSWCSSNKANDNRAITIEVACVPKHPYTVTDKAMNSLINLCADICKRNGIKKLVWSTNKIDRVNHKNGCNMTVHRDFKNKSCPGEYLYSNHGYIANEVNKLLSASSSTSSAPGTTSFYMYGAEPKSIVSGNQNHFSQIVKNIQTTLNKDYGLKFSITGIVDNALLINLGNIVMSTNSYNKNLTYCLQQLFVWWNVKLDVDGLFGTQVKNNITNFQKIWKISATGTTTKEFWNKILGK